MKIAIYKPYKTIHWNDIAKDTNVWSREIKNFALMMRDNGHEVSLLSETDYRNNEKGIFKQKLEHIEDTFDVLVIFNGAFSRDQHTENNILNMIPHSYSILMATDMDLTNEEHSPDLYDVVLTATNQKLWGSHTLYGAVQDYHMYGEELYKGGWEIRKHEGIFIGHDRHKEELFLEYVMRPKMNFFGKSSRLNINKIIPRDEAYHKLRTHTYSIVFFDDRVTSNGFVTARPLELMLHGVLPFIDVNYDNDELQFATSNQDENFLIVNNYEEFLQKTSNMSKDRFLHIQKVMFEKIEKIVKGEEAYKLFLKAVEHAKKRTN